MPARHRDSAGMRVRERDGETRRARACKRGRPCPTWRRRRRRRRRRGHGNCALVGGHGPVPFTTLALATGIAPRTRQRKKLPGPDSRVFLQNGCVCVCVCVCVRARGYYAPCATCLACKTARRTRRVCEHCVFRHEVTRAPNVRSGAGRGGGTFALIASRLALGFAAPFRLRTLARACLACKPARSTRRVCEHLHRKGDKPARGQGNGRANTPLPFLPAPALPAAFGWSSWARAARALSATAGGADAAFASSTLRVWQREHSFLYFVSLKASACLQFMLRHSESQASPWVTTQPACPHNSVLTRCCCRYDRGSIGGTSSSG